jgi:hypothetical protein
MPIDLEMSPRNPTTHREFEHTRLTGCRMGFTSRIDTR